ncbi:ATP-grasp domain-containing protein [Candidatus Kaiserbacteria bacterium]|nr:ATP-grasp domain-containing protein [Candidatus Kaiserbacteria bacterium]
MARTSVGILRGGTSSEYDLSLKTGAAMLAALPEDRYDTRDIFVDKRGYWHLRGAPVDASRALSQIDVVLNALHGGVGEDGTVQRILERAGVPYAGARPQGASLSLNKVRAREALQRAGIRMPQAVSFTLGNELTTGEMAQFTFSQFGPPYVVKPVQEGSSTGIRMAMTPLELPDVIGDVLDAFGAALVEQYIRGEEANVGVIEDFRNEELYVLPPAQVVLPEGSRFIEPSHHHEGTLRHTVPSNFTHAQKQAIAELARAAHRALGLSHFSRADMILTPRTVYLLEVDTIPGLYPGASFQPMLESVGSSVPEFLEHAIKLAMR